MDNLNKIELVRRRRNSSSRAYNKPLVKLELPSGRFLLSQKLADILKVDQDDGVMFGFNQKSKTAYILKDDEPDAYILRRKSKNSLRFCSKDLQNYFVNTFDISNVEKKVFYFEASSKANDKGMLPLTLNDNQ